MVNNNSSHPDCGESNFDASNPDCGESNFDASNPGLFARIAEDIRTKGYSINPCALPLNLGDCLLERINTMSDENFVHARIGREQFLIKNQFVRKNEICWITNESDAGKDWLQWISELQLFLNRHLLLGLFSFESHFSHYAVGDFYKRHVDALRSNKLVSSNKRIDSANRVLSVVVYLNPDWIVENSGELVLYRDELDQEGIKVTPNFGTVVVFLSEDFPHEVLATNRDRYSIAGWFRVNTSTTDRVDPPV